MLVFSKRSGLLSDYFYYNYAIVFGIFVILVVLFENMAYYFIAVVFWCIFIPFFVWLIVDWAYYMMVQVSLVEEHIWFRVSIVYSLVLFLMSELLLFCTFFGFLGSLLVTFSPFKKFYFLL